ncbi:transposase [Ruegeria jejuensis]|uniref:transposase n=1 Tax=Ruegeria jejuensis TaxID=3233338 RepID=UPI00355BF06D
MRQCGLLRTNGDATENVNTQDQQRFGREGRISRWDHEHLVDEMRDRLSRDPTFMGLRCSTVEHPFGTIKAWMGATHVRMRRLKNVPTEMAFHVLAYNIKRMIALIGVRGLLTAIPA